MEIFDGGHIYVDESDGDCLNPKFDESNPMSYYGGTKDGNKATFNTDGKPGKWSGELFVVQGDTDSIEVSDLNIGLKQFQVLQKVTKCVAAPSMSPSVLPTDLPSYSSIPSMFPTRDPSESPSNKPSSNPSLKPSNIHSSLPSLHPTALHPNACPSDGFLGRTIKSVVFGDCWSFELFAGGNVKIDPTDSTCSKTTPHSSTYVLGEYKENRANKIFFETIPSTTDAAWEGYIEVLEDTKLTQESLELTKLGWNTNKLGFTLSVPECASSEPSTKPSSKPSTSTSSKPSIQPTVNKPTYTAFKTTSELKKAVTDYCNNPDGWKDNTKYKTHGPIEDWNTSEITDMSLVFYWKQSCNPNLAKWDVSKVTTFYGMFFLAIAFNGDISNWDTSSATTFQHMFYQALAFNGDISKWDTSKVTNFQYMFEAAGKFNQDLSNWDTSSATTFRAMFHVASAFNGDLSKWDTSKVINFERMFSGATLFDQNLCNWNVDSATNVYEFCRNSHCGNCSWYV